MNIIVANKAADIFSHTVFLTTFFELSGYLSVRLSLYTKERYLIWYRLSSRNSWNRPKTKHQAQ